MKKRLMIMALLLTSLSTFALSPLPSNSLSPTIKQMEFAWRSAQSTHALQDKNDITIVYGGQDISLGHTVLERTMTA